MSNFMSFARVPWHYMCCQAYSPVLMYCDRLSAKANKNRQISLWLFGHFRLSVSLKFQHWLSWPTQTSLAGQLWIIPIGLDAVSFQLGYSWYS